MTMTFAVPAPFVEPPSAPRRKAIVCEVALETRDAARAVIEDAINNNPRSQQKRIGPSQVGNECEFCLGCKLAGVEMVDSDALWLPFIGTAVHAELERIFGKSKYIGEWVTEQRVSVGRIDGTVIDGSSDLFHLLNGTVVDWKCVGDSTLKEARLGGPSQQYQKQAHLYGRGFAAKGHEVNHVAIFFLPRNSRSLDDAVWWATEYDEDVAISALLRAEGLKQAIDTFGADVVLPDLDRKPGCYDCARNDAALELEGSK